MYRLLKSILLLSLFVGPVLSTQAESLHFPLEIFPQAPNGSPVKSPRS
jgi:hypothetical protein